MDFSPASPAQILPLVLVVGHDLGRWVWIRCRAVVTVDARLHSGSYCLAIDLGRDELKPTVAGFGKNAIADAAVIMPMLTERRTEALQETDRARTRVGWRRGPCRRTPPETVPCSPHSGCPPHGGAYGLAPCFHRS